MELTAFRSYTTFSLSSALQPVVLTGPNGVGKTNLLEALSFLIPGRGLRRARLGDIRQQHSETPWALSYTLTDDIYIGTGQDPENPERRIIKINGERAKNQTTLSEWISMVWLTPQMDRLFLEGASGRRRFLDRLVYGLDPTHAARINRYEHALRERNLLLRQGRYDVRWLEGLEDILVQEGGPITEARSHVISQLQNVLNNQDQAFPRPQLALQADSLITATALAEARRYDTAAGRTSLGPHHSDLTVVFPAKNQSAALCSTGEQKALLLSIVMASAHLLAARTGAIPLLLLDEVVAHLDAARRQALFEAILSLNMQTWLTGTDVSLFEGLEHHAQFVELAPHPA